MTNNDSKELDTLHSAIMALEELLVEKGIVSLDELNEAIKRASKEVQEARKDEREIIDINS